MPRRNRIAQTLAGTIILLVSLVSVGLTAPTDGPLSIRIRPIGLSFNPAAIAASGDRALGLDIVLTVGSWHRHYVWSAISLSRSSTKDIRNLL